MVNPPTQESWLKIAAFVIVVATAVSVAGYVFDRLLLHEGVPRYDLLAISNTLTGIVAGGFFWEVLRRERERRKFVETRLRTIAEMNHHIRNALQVISFYSSIAQDQKTVNQLRDAVNRIEWSLEEVLPGELEGDTAAKWSPQRPSQSINK
jgi:signal transduction histidine kinase